VIGVGVVGTGVAALTAHLPALSASRRFELVAMLDTAPDRLEPAAGRFPEARGCVEPEEFFALPGLDAVVIATPPDSHASLASEALRRGKHVLVEKPLARSVEECDSLIELAVKRGLTLCVGLEKRFHSTLEQVRGLLESGVVGDPFYCGVHWASAAKLDPARLIPDGFDHGYRWRWGNRSIGGGLLHDHLPHYVDLLRHWTGLEPESVYCHCANVARDKLRWSPEDSVWEDFGLVVVRFSGGLAMRFETSVVGRSLSPIWSLGSGAGEWTEYGYFLGTRGALVFDLLPWDSSEHGRIALWQLEAATRERHGWTYIEQPEPRRRAGGAAEAMFLAQTEAWADAIEGRETRIARGYDGAVCVAAVEAAYRSSRTRAEAPVGPLQPGTVPVKEAAL
jgi:predicted dehydrogenase